MTGRRGYSACLFHPKIDWMPAGVKPPGWSATDAVDGTQPIRTCSSAGCMGPALDLAPAREWFFTLASSHAKELLQAA